VGAGDVRAQTEQIFENLRLILAAANSGLECVAKLTVFTTRLEYRPTIHEVRSAAFREVGHLPASTLAVVTSLADPAWLVEIDAIAAVRTERAGQKGGGK
jgi:2-iminobutanoate/2-iminopropanoate deaminase